MSHPRSQDALSRVELLRGLEEAQQRQAAMMNLRHSKLVKVIQWECVEALAMLDEAGLPRPNWKHE